MNLGPITGAPGLLAKPQLGGAALLALVQAGHMPLPAGAGWQVIPKGAGFVLRLSPQDAPSRDLPVTAAQVAQLAQGQATVETIATAASPVRDQKIALQDQTKTPEAQTTAPAAPQALPYAQSPALHHLPFGAAISPHAVPKGQRSQQSGQKRAMPDGSSATNLPPIGGWVFFALFLLLLAAAMV